MSSPKTSPVHPVGSCGGALAHTGCNCARAATGPQGVELPSGALAVEPTNAPVVTIADDPASVTRLLDELKGRDDSESEAARTLPFLHSPDAARKKITASQARGEFGSAAMVLSYEVTAPASGRVLDDAQVVALASALNRRADSITVLDGDDMTSSNPVFVAAGASGDKDSVDPGGFYAPVPSTEVGTPDNPATDAANAMLDTYDQDAEHYGFASIPTGRILASAGADDQTRSDLRTEMSRAVMGDAEFNEHGMSPSGREISWEVAGTDRERPGNVVVLVRHDFDEILGGQGQTRHWVQEHLF